jgi:hypothetical protein
MALQEYPLNNDHCQLYWHLNQSLHQPSRMGNDFQPAINLMENGVQTKKLFAYPSTTKAEKTMSSAWCILFEWCQNQLVP